MMNNDVLLFSATNEETPYEQLLHLLFSSNIENQTIKKKEASTKNLETKVFVLIENWNIQTKRKLAVYNS